MHGVRQTTMAEGIFPLQLRSNHILNFELCRLQRGGASERGMEARGEGVAVSNRSLQDANMEIYL